MVDRFQFFYRSTNSPPGKGVGEYVKDSKIYDELSTIEGWRRIFSSLWNGESFYYHGSMYRSFEHAFQSAKFRIAGYNEVSKQFALESGSDLALGNGLDARRGRKMVILNSEELRRWGCQRGKIKTEIYQAKFSQGLPRKALLATQKAELWSYFPRGKKIRCERLEKLRKELNEK